MKKIPDLRYQSGMSVLELRLKARGAVHYYHDNWFVGRFESLEDAFARIHGRVDRISEIWPSPITSVPRAESDWTPVPESAELIAA